MLEIEAPSCSHSWAMSSGLSFAGFVPLTPKPAAWELLGRDRCQSVSWVHTQWGPGIQEVTRRHF